MNIGDMNTEETWDLANTSRSFTMDGRLCVTKALAELGFIHEPLKRAALMGQIADGSIVVVDA